MVELLFNQIRYYRTKYALRSKSKRQFGFSFFDFQNVEGNYEFAGINQNVNFDSYKHLETLLISRDLIENSIFKCIISDYYSSSRYEIQTFY